ncbi:Allene oxide synthase 3, partial [Mucuna pruriens]
MASSDSTSGKQLPLKPIPGSYGFPFLGAIRDRYDYFYNQGRDKFFTTRIQRHNSTVFRTNMPPGPFISSDPRVIALLDGASFPILFDNDKVEKFNVFLGTFMPSINVTGGYRICSYLDTEEPNHALIKRFFFNVLAERKDTVVPLFRSCLQEAFGEVEDQLSKNAKGDFNAPFAHASFNFIFRFLCDNKHPSKTNLSSQGPKLADTWIGFQLLPNATLGLPKIFNYIEDLLIHTIPIPACFTKSTYKKLYEAFNTSATTVLDEAEGLGLKRNEACHNVVFMACFNSYGGFKNQFPVLMKWVGQCGQKLHAVLASEVRSVVNDEGGVTLNALEKMSLLKSVVYETMRIEPLVPYQYARAREDMVVQSHDASFQVKKGEMLFGYQPFATNDSRIFEDAEVFVPHRFIGEGEKMLKHVFWSNGRETEEPSPSNKQCPGKNLVVLLCRLFLVDLFLRYDTFEFKFKESGVTRNKTSSKQLPLKPIPGSYGVPFFGAIRDRHDYFYNQGRDKFFATRIQQHKSTVIRTNMPPGPFISSDPRVIALLDGASFPILFDNDKVEKLNVLDGTFMPSTKFTGGHRVCAYLDTKEPNHALIKRFYLNVLVARKDTFVPLFRNCLQDSFAEIEDQLCKNDKADFNAIFSDASFNFIFRLLSDNKDPSHTNLGSKGPKLVDMWLLLQLAPLATLGLPKIFNYIEDILLRTLPFPAWLTKSGYQKLYKAFETSATTVLDEAEKLGLNRSEACHNVVFTAGFNAYGGLKNQFPVVIKWVGLGGEKLHADLASEIRRVVKEEGGVTLNALEKMSLVKSVVYEVMRIEPAVPYQYARAREDLVVQNHDASFQVKKGEMLFGYQPFATKDSRIFEDAEVFVPRRFIGEGEKMLKHVLWSNGRETEEPSPSNKQCPGKNLVLLLCRLLLVDLFLRYDTFEFEFNQSAFGPNITIKSLTKASTF